MKAKMLVFDLDGTLLHDDKTISEYTLSVLEKIRENNIKIVVATGRGGKLAQQHTDQIKPDAIITYGGSLAKKNDKVIHKCLLQADVVDRLLKECFENPDVENIHVYAETGFYIDYVEVRPEYAHGEYFDFSKPFSKDIYKISVCIKNKNIVLEIASKFPECNIISLSGEFLNIHHFINKDTEKISAIVAVAKEFEIDIKDIITFGNDFNDVEMTKACGTGVAVANAIDELKEVSDYICDTNENDGVAKWIEENIS